MSKRNIAEEIRIDYRNNTNIDRFGCKQTFSSSERNFLADIGFKKNRLANHPTIWYKTYGEDVDGYGALLELILNPYEEPGSVSVNVHADIMGNIEYVDEIDFSFSNCAGALYRDLFSLSIMKLIWFEDVEDVEEEIF